MDPQNRRRHHRIRMTISTASGVRTLSLAEGGRPSPLVDAYVKRRGNAISKMAAETCPHVDTFRHDAVKTLLLHKLQESELQHLVPTIAHMVGRHEAGLQFRLERDADPRDISTLPPQVERPTERFDESLLRFLCNKGTELNHGGHPGDHPLDSGLQGFDLQPGHVLSVETLQKSDPDFCGTRTDRLPTKQDRAFLELEYPEHKYKESTVWIGGDFGVDLARGKHTFEIPQNVVADLGKAVDEERVSEAFERLVIWEVFRATSRGRCQDMARLCESAIQYGRGRQDDELIDLSFELLSRMSAMARINQRECARFLNLGLDRRLFVVSEWDFEETVTETTNMVWQCMEDFELGVMIEPGDTRLKTPFDNAVWHLLELADTELYKVVEGQRQAAEARKMPRDAAVRTVGFDTDHRTQRLRAYQVP